MGTNKPFKKPADDVAAISWLISNNETRQALFANKQDVSNMNSENGILKQKVHSNFAQDMRFGRPAATIHYRRDRRCRMLLFTLNLNYISGHVCFRSLGSHLIISWSSRELTSCEISILGKLDFSCSKDSKFSHDYRIRSNGCYVRESSWNSRMQDLLYKWISLSSLWKIPPHFLTGVTSGNQF
jgi:hypothetical protein